MIPQALTPFQPRMINPLRRGNQLAISLLIGSALLASLFFGLLTVFLGVETEIGLAFVMAALSMLIVAIIVLVSGISGRDWAIAMTFFFVALVMEGTLRRRELTATGIDGQTLAKLMVWSGALLIALVNRQALGKALRESPGLAFLLLFALWATFSTTYSLTPGYTFGCGVAFLCLVTFIPLAIERIGERSVYLTLVFVCGLLTMTAIGVYVVAPSLAVAKMEGGSIERLAGLTGSPNNLGRVAALGLLLIFFMFRANLIGRWRIDIWLIVIAAVTCLGLSWSRTSAIALVFAVSLVVLRRHPALRWSLIAASVTALIAVLNVDLNWNALVRLVSRSGSVEELFTLTGRTSIWEFSWNEFLERPLQGWGFGATKLLVAEQFRTYWGWTTTSAHNMGLQILVTTGIVGGTLATGCVIWQVKQFFRKPADLPDALFVFIMVSGLAEAGAAGVAPNILTLAWVVSVAMPRDEAPTHSPVLP